MEDQQNISQKVHQIHLCGSEKAILKEYGRTDCPYCGERKVTALHMCRRKIGSLTHVCYNCGRVSDDPSKLCKPRPIDDIQSTNLKHLPPRQSQELVCYHCNRQIKTKPGHQCDLIFPYVCRHCHKYVTNFIHVCFIMIDRAKYVCKDCGRLAVDKNEVCKPMEIKK